MVTLLNQLRRTAVEEQTQILFPEVHDERVLKAAGIVAEKGIARPVLLDADSETEQLCENLGRTSGQLEFRQVSDEERTEYAAAYAEIRGVTQKQAEKMVSSSLVLGALLVRLGEVDGMVAGAVHPTAEVVAVANGIIGLASGVDTASSYFLMVFEDDSIGEDGVLLYADCGVNITPSPKQLADVSVATAKTASRLFNWDPRIALLSFSTHGSSQHEVCQDVSRAAELAGERVDTGVIDGELQADAALVPDIADRKVSESGQIKGDANILVFPDLNAGNIAYKLTERLAGANALGPILQGYAHPVSDLSRGASVDDIVKIATITAVEAIQDPYSGGDIITKGLLNRQESEAVEEQTS
ncbi:phosphate acetyltransferase [halophilic archaeon]|nr:phosphate acetyltransferase [halophilic archaeon]